MGTQRVNVYGDLNRRVCWLGVGHTGGCLSVNLGAGLLRELSGDRGSRFTVELKPQQSFSRIAYRTFKKGLQFGSEVLQDSFRKPDLSQHSLHWYSISCSSDGGIASPSLGGGLFKSRSSCGRGRGCSSDRGCCISCSDKQDRCGMHFLCVNWTRRRNEMRTSDLFMKSEAAHDARDGPVRPRGGG